MAQRQRQFTIVFDRDKKRCSINGGPWVRFKGCISQDKMDAIVEEQKKKDQTKDPGPSPTDRDGYWVCKLANNASFKTWHWCLTYSPYECFDSEDGPCP